MAEQRTSIALADGSVETGFKVGVDESTERWSEYKLSDGSTLRLKQVVAEVIRAENQWDPQGNPLYILKAAPVLVVDNAPAHLLKNFKKS
jgi:hypothetical protein